MSTLNWMDPKEYEFAKTLRPDRWAWEFLRRNPEYRSDWQEALSGLRDARHTTADALPIDPAAPEFVIPSNTAHDLWGLVMGYVNPDQDRPENLYFVQRNEVFLGPLPDQLDTQRTVTVNLKPGQVLYRGDPSYEITPQVRSFQRIMKLEQAYRVRNGCSVERRRPGRKSGARETLRRFYLQLLDGKAAGASNNDILDAFDVDPIHHDRDPPLDEQLLRDRLRAARRLTEPEGYLSLIG